MKILLISDNEWVKESLEKYLDFDHELTHEKENTQIDFYFDYIFVDMQVQNNGGPSIIRELKRKDSTKKGLWQSVVNSDALITIATQDMDSK